MKHYRLYVFDLDGTVYRGSEPIPYAAQVVLELINRGALVRYFTNNSAARPIDITRILNSMGLPCEPDWVYGTGALAVHNCLKRGYTRVYLVGEQGLAQTFAEADFVISDESPEAVIVGICRSFTYSILDTASRLVREGAELIVTNRDATYPIEGGVEQPGAGSIAAAIEVASNTNVLELGKPNSGLLEQIFLDLAGRVSKQETLVIGDRMDTDIECGKRAGCDTWLTLTGVTKVPPPAQKGSEDLRELLSD